MKALSKKEHDAMGARFLRNSEREIIRRMRHRIEKGILNASLVNDDGLDDQGSEVILNEREKRVARDLRKSRRNAPVYLEFQLRRVEGAEKAELLRDQPKVSLNIGTLVQVQPVAYPVVQIDDKKIED